jgi:hypothetical protein
MKILQNTGIEIPQFLSFSRETSVPSNLRRYFCFSSYSTLLQTCRQISTNIYVVLTLAVVVSVLKTANSRHLNTSPRSRWFHRSPHCKKRLAIFPSPSRDVTYQTGNNLITLFPARENLVIDILAGAGKNANLFLQRAELWSSF